MAPSSHLDSSFASLLTPVRSKDVFNIASRVTIPQDTELRGEITIGSGTILHPKCTIVAMSGPIIIGADCIIEENVILVNRTKSTMVIGDNNVFHVGCRVESLSIGSYNTFGHKSRVLSSIVISSNCQIGAGCIVSPSPSHQASNSGSSEISSSYVPPTSLERNSLHMERGESNQSTVSNTEPSIAGVEVLPDYTVVFGSENRRRVWSGEGIGQSRALHAKHLEYLRDVISKHKLKMFV